MLNAGTQSFFGCDALENSFFVQDGQDTALSPVDDRAWVGNLPAVPEVGETTPTSP